MTNKRSNPYCPSCDQKIAGAEINITEGVALCSECGLLSQLSELNYTSLPVEETLKKSPKRAHIISDPEQIKIHISLFSIGKFFTSLVFTLFWNSIISVFLGLAVAAVAYNTIGYVPDWLPVLGLEDGKPVMNDQVMGPGMTLGICLFLIPFVLIGVGMLINTLLRIFGTTTIVIDRRNSFVSTGISFLRLKKSFDPHKVKSIRRTLYNLNKNTDTYLIEMEIEDNKKVKLGRLLNDPQQDWVLILLKQILLHKHSSKNTTQIPHLYWLK